jgi:hypothetical protein
LGASTTKAVVPAGSTISYATGPDSLPGAALAHPTIICTRKRWWRWGQGGAPQRTHAHYEGQTGRDANAQWTSQPAARPSHLARGSAARRSPLRQPNAEPSQAKPRAKPSQGWHSKNAGRGSAPAWRPVRRHHRPARSWGTPVTGSTAPRRHPLAPTLCHTNQSINPTINPNRTTSRAQILAQGVGGCVVAEGRRGWWEVAVGRRRHRMYPGPHCR